MRAKVYANLKEFGYDVTQEYVDGEIDKLLKSEKPTNIIGMMTETMLQEAGIIS